LSELIWQGLQLSVAGLGLTFTGLGILIGAIFLIRELFKDQPAPPPAQEVKPPSSATDRSAQANEEVVAAIAVALAHLQKVSLSQGRLGKSLEKGRGAWWFRGQAEQRPFVRPRTGGRN